MESVLYSHILPIIGVWLGLIIALQLIKYGVLKVWDIFKLGKKKDRVVVGKVAKAMSISATLIAACILVFVVFFLSNINERKVIKTIEPAQVDESFIPDSKKGIDITNKEVVDRKHRVKEEEATQDNSRAMEEASNLFKTTND